MLYEVNANDHSVQYTPRKSKSFTDQMLLDQYHIIFRTRNGSKEIK